MATMEAWWGQQAWTRSKCPMCPTLPLSTAHRTTLYRRAPSRVAGISVSICLLCADRAVASCSCRATSSQVHTLWHKRNYPGRPEPLQTARYNVPISLSGICDCLRSNCSPIIVHLLERLHLRRPRDTRLLLLKRRAPARLGDTQRRLAYHMRTHVRKAIGRWSRLQG